MKHVCGLFLKIDIHPSIIYTQDKSEGEESYILPPPHASKTPNIQLKAQFKGFFRSCWLHVLRL